MLSGVSWLLLPVDWLSNTVVACDKCCAVPSSCFCVKHIRYCCNDINPMIFTIIVPSQRCCICLQSLQHKVAFCVFNLCSPRHDILHTYLQTLISTDQADHNIYQSMKNSSKVAFCVFNLCSPRHDILHTYLQTLISTDQADQNIQRLCVI